MKVEKARDGEHGLGTTSRIAQQSHGPDRGFFMQSVFDEYTMGSALNPMRAIPSDTGLMHGSPELDRWNEMMNNRTENQTNQGMGASSWRMAWLGVWALVTGLLGIAQPALAAPASMQVVVSPSQTTYWRAGEIITYNYVLYHTGGTATDDILTVK